MKVEFNVGDDEKFEVNDSGPSFPIIEVTETEDVVFYTPCGDEMLRLCANGDFLVKKQKVTNDIEIYQAMKKLLFPR
jgi:hypothetical protein